MVQVFSKRSSAVFRLAAYTVPMLGLLGAWSLAAWQHSPLREETGEAPPQPIPFNHQHHVEAARLDCRFCHASAETAAFAGLPTTETCMGCHTWIWRENPVLQPVRDSYARKEPIRWVRVNWLPEFVYFRHDIHLANGVGCVSCHGHVEKQTFTARYRYFKMKDCLKCHREASTRPGARPAARRIAGCTSCHR